MLARSGGRPTPRGGGARARGARTGPGPHPIESANSIADTREAGRLLEEESVGRPVGGVRAGYVPATPAAPRDRAAGPSGNSGKGLGHLADLDVATGRGRGARARLRTRGAGIPARNAPRNHWRQPAAPVLVDARGAGTGRRSGADVPGRAGGRIRLRSERRRDRVRDRRGPGTGRQDARGAPAGALALAHLLRRPARPAQLRRGHELRGAAGDRSRFRPRESRVLRRRDRARHARTTCR